MVAQRSASWFSRLRWWMFGPFWRYERPQKGRTREFFQWNIDLIGANTPECDAEMIALPSRFFKEVGLGPTSGARRGQQPPLDERRTACAGHCPEMLARRLPRDRPAR
jgi:hypothetical protein